MRPLTTSQVAVATNATFLITPNALFPISFWPRSAITAFLASNLSAPSFKRSSNLDFNASITSAPFSPTIFLNALELESFSIALVIVPTTFFQISETPIVSATLAPATLAALNPLLATDAVAFTALVAPYLASSIALLPTLARGVATLPTAFCPVLAILPSTPGTPPLAIAFSIPGVKNLELTIPAIFPNPLIALPAVPVIAAF